MNPLEERDREVIRAALREIRLGHHESYRRIVERFEHRLFSLALVIAGDRAGAEDIVQDALLRAYTHLDRYDEHRSFYPWLATITVNAARNWLRSRARVEQQADPLAEVEGSLSADPVEEMIVDERSGRLWRSVSSLPQGERTAVLLYYRQDMKVGEVAQILGVTTGTVKTLLFRAREKLRALMNDERCKPSEEEGCK